MLDDFIRFWCDVCNAENSTTVSRKLFDFFLALFFDKKAHFSITVAFLLPYFEIYYAVLTLLLDDYLSSEDQPSTMIETYQPIPFSDMKCCELSYLLSTSASIFLADYVASKQNHDLWMVACWWVACWWVAHFINSPYGTGDFQIQSAMTKRIPLRNVDHHAHQKK